MENPLPKFLIFDIENTPLLGYAWGVREVDVFKVIRHSYILSIAYQWYPSTKIHTIALPDFEGYDPGAHDDKKLCEAFWKILNEAEVICGQNSDNFDVKKLNTRFLFHDLPALPPRFSIDTLKINRQVFGHPSNKLDEVCQYHGIGRKLPHSGKDLWFGCMEGNERDWRLMRKYNAHDVYLTRALYDRIRPWAKTHPNLNILTHKQGACPRCQSTDLVMEGLRYTATQEFQRFHCRNCGSWSQQKVGPLAKKIQIT